MGECIHQVQYNGLCAICGSLLDLDDLTGVTGSPIVIGYDTVGLSISREEAERLEAENARRLLKLQKLSLIIDLDRTIAHATTSQHYKPTTPQDVGKQDIRQFKLSTTSSSDIIYYVKLRPGLKDFLNEISQFYELHIYTMGTREYADMITKEIDPKGTIFKERILSRNESGSVTQKKLQRLFPCDTSMVVVLDDRWDIWNFSPNLIRIKPYEFFININNDDDDSNTTDHIQHNLTTTQNDNDNELYTMLKILKQVHQTFYSKPIQDKSTDVTRIIPIMKQQVLKDTIITFSDRILPQQNDPSLSWIWQMASSYGAHCSIDLTGKTTHLIAIPATSRNKVKAARRYGQPNLHVVTPGWLFDSTARWAIQSEENYALPELKYSNQDDEEKETQEEEEEEEDFVKNINWDEADREVEDFINESGIDDVWGDTDSENMIENNNSPTTSRKSTPSRRNNTNWKRKRVVVESGGDSGGDEEGSEDEVMSFLAKRRLKAKKRGKSQLSKVVTLSPSNNSSSGSSSDNEDSLDEFADILDEVLE
ncbi:uncharacterized protein BX663DRAFT_524654 [Cokeromyces recurvatus]|uniref:uncharacterized protein n=1 Tax=Cokeromyces recurvatus TaxID=90255 RepID=UPI00221E7072|nr:uncharacterized protein BX663DRAFT_524654 [Cokeromyces recurvatus]KAI7898577.1 hypothetical protein BX663DRAFT_524654 [Cokeromyces recurvatus]